MQQSLSLPENKKFILFDGVCNLCSTAVQTIIKHDKNDVFRFVALQSDLGLAIQKHIAIDTRKIDSLILYVPGVSYSYKSEAVLDIAKELGGIFSLTIIFKILPTPLLNAVYDYVAKNRYKWFGHQEQCWMPTPELNAKFL
ncbi:MAG: thiol-disulfide oxidoreductase DCC family protein [Flavobacterium sp.]